jgi:hypothetical protein
MVGKRLKRFAELKRITDAQVFAVFPDRDSAAEIYGKRRSN